MTLVLTCFSLIILVHVCLNTLTSQDSSVSTSPMYSIDATTKNEHRNGHTGNQNITKNFKILILSYMRSGSTLTGDLFQFHPSIFYVYEPLLYLWDYYVPEKQHAALGDLQRRVKSFWKKRKPFIPPPKDFINYMFQCNLTAYNLDFLTNAAHSHHFKETGCPVLKYGMNLINTSQNCVNDILARCMKSRGVVLKVVRLTMVEADNILQYNPDVKIIHVVRDPRGILSSRMHFNKKVKGEMHKNYVNICKRIWDDLKFSKLLTKKYTGRILTVRYEDLAQNLINATKAMLRFVGLDMAPQIKRHIEEITSSGDQRMSGPKKTTRTKPYQTAYKWRQKLSFSLVQQVDQACKKIYKLMGYLTFSSEKELWDQNLQAKSDFYGNGLLTLSVR